MATQKDRQGIIDLLNKCGGLSYNNFVDFLYSIPFLNELSGGTFDSFISRFTGLWTSGYAIAGKYDVDYYVSYNNKIYRSIVNNNNAVPGADSSWVLQGSSEVDVTGYKGLATPATNPGTPVTKGFWIVTTAGTYTNMGGVVLPANSMGVISWDLTAFTIGYFTMTLSQYALASDLLINTKKLNTISEVKSTDYSFFSITNGYLDHTTGNFVASANWRSTGFIDVTLVSAVEHMGVTSASADAVVFYDGAFAKISTGYGNSTDLTNHIVVVPSNAVYVRFCATIVSSNPYSYKLQKSQIRYDSLPFGQFKDQTFLPGTTNGFISRASGTEGNFAASANWRSTDFIDVAENDIVKYTGTTPGASAGAVVGYDANKAFAAIILGQTTDGTLKTIPVSNGIKYIRMCATVASGATYLFKITKFVVNLSNIELPAVLTVDTILKQLPTKTWNAVGHSIWWQDGKLYTSGPQSGSIAIGIQTLVRNHVKFGGYNNYGYSGRSLSGTSNTDVQSILADKASWVPADIWSYDSITNDFKLNRPTGTSSDFLNNTGITTYYGALRILHDTIKALTPNYLMICASPLQRNNASYTSFSRNTVAGAPLGGYTMQDYIDCLMWVRNYLSWRFVDQFNNSGINMENLTENTIDGLHPFDTGYAKYQGLWISEFNKIS